VSRSAAVRADAAKIVADVATRGRSLDVALSFDPQTTRQERGLIRALAYDSIRWYLRLDALLGRLLARPAQKVDPDVRALAIVGLCQLLYTDIPAHAAVAETVEAARALGHPRAAGLINAVLRRCQREHAQLAAQIDRDVAVRTAHPRWLVDALAADWGEQHTAILAANNQRPPFWVRVNRRRSSGSQYRNRLADSGIAVADSMFGDEALLLADAMDVAELPGFAAGEVSIQDAAAQLGARLLAPRAGERVLDACAAPGG
jgi:16S rRNA (cytosine967-C5)-methyltransferase